MTEQEKKELMGKYAKKLETTIKTEKARLMEMEDDKLNLATLKEKNNLVLHLTIQFIQTGMNGLNKLKKKSKLEKLLLQI